MPIRAGEAVRYMLITENPFGERRVVPVTSTNGWFPRTFPLRAKYNDCGAVEALEKGPQQDIWLEALRIDMIERDVGDNTYHDLAVRRSMPLAQLCEAIPEGRLLVRRKRHAEKTKAPVGVPTRRRVEARLRASGEHVDDPSLPPPAEHPKVTFIVDRLSYGIVRVRVGSSQQYGADAAQLEAVRDALRDYATVVTAGSGSYAGPAELLVFAAGNGRGADRFHYGCQIGQNRRKAESSRVSHIMIREDVWQALIAMSKEPMTDCVWKTYEETQRLLATRVDPIVMSALLSSSINDDSFASVLVANKNIMGASFHEHWLMYAKRGIPVKDAEPFLRTVSDMGAAMRTLLDIRFAWRPSGSVGDQYGDMERHREFHRLMMDVADCRLEEDARGESGL
jgi:hypothetical protein